MGSTPPISPAHKWTTRYIPEAIASSAYIHRTIEHNPRLTAKEREFFIHEAGGPDAHENLRENYAQHIVDDELAIIPEFSKNEADIVEEFEVPKYFDAYVSLDPGFTDLSCALFAFYDFERNLICIQDDLALSKSNTQELASAILLKEAALWRGVLRKDGKPQPLLRVSDVDLRLISDFQIQHHLTFVPTQKEDKQSAINAARLAIAQQRVRIHPRCTTLIAHLKHGIWNRHRTSFERSGDYGHFDAIDAFIYLVRNIHKGSNPYPQYRKGEHGTTHFMRERPVSDTARKIQSIFASKRQALRRHR